jgi:hypothetical protein
MWTVIKDRARLEQVRTSELAGYRACGVLGAAGLGKTYELRYLADLEKRNGLDVRFERLAVIAQTPDSLVAQLAELSAAASKKSVIYLDALDEVMVPVKVAGLVVERWIRKELAAKQPAIRISCRSALWSPDILAALSDVYGEESCAVAILQPLSSPDVKHIAASRGLDADRFEAAIQRAGTQSLSQQPLTLEMLLRIYEVGKSMPSDRCDLFSKGVNELARDRIERLEAGTAIEFTLPEVLEAAERLACFSLLSGRETIDLSDSPSPASLGRTELAGLPSKGRILDDHLVRAVGRCGLCESDEPRRFRFAHRQIAEYLAGRTMARLLPHQSKALLCSGQGWQAGVATPLRETAAFTAIESEPIADWLADSDPEVIGISDVVSDSIRRKATLNLLERFRRRELTDIQILWGAGMEFKGFQYEGAEADLRPVLRERGNAYSDVLECVVKLIENWQLASMSDDLAELALDSQAPIEARRAAGYALHRMGTTNARTRLRPLINDHDADPDLDLKGLALWCNWPHSLSATELLHAVKPHHTNRSGAYEGFLIDLDRSGFDAAGNRLAGLVWSLDFIHPDSDILPAGRIAKRIAIASVDELEHAGMASALIDVILASATNHGHSPLTLTSYTDLDGAEAESPPPVLEGKRAARRILLDELAGRTLDGSMLWLVKQNTPALVLEEDFPWLLERATTENLPMDRRLRYVQLAKTLPWLKTAENVEAWLALRTIEPLASHLSMRLSSDLNSEEAANAKKAREAEKRHNTRPTARKKLRPPPKKRVRHFLDLCETKDARFFTNLSNEMTLEEQSTQYGFSRILITTPGWDAADLGTRNRIVEAAKRFLTTKSDEPERCRSSPLNSILPGYMPAMLLAIRQDSKWMEQLASKWWRRWCWYIVRELRPGLTGEQDNQDSLHDLLKVLQKRAPVKLQTAIEELATSSDPAAEMELSSLLDVFTQIGDAKLAIPLLKKLVDGRIPDDRIVDVARFVLSAQDPRTLSKCMTCIGPKFVPASDTLSVRIAVAMLLEHASSSWPKVFELLQRRPDLARRILEEFAHERNRRPSSKNALSRPVMSFTQVGELVAELLKTFPPENDPQNVGARYVGPVDSARWLRDQLISWLGSSSDMKAVETLRLLEMQFGEKYTWLRRPRAQAERLHRQSCWAPISPEVVTDLLISRDKRLIRSGHDAVEGVLEAMQGYASRLRQDGLNDIEDLWNLAKNALPTPREEERVSVKICAAIRDYFRGYAVTADREVQVFRRKLSRQAGGSPGSEVDVLLRIPAIGVASSDPIVVPIEVKLSHNPDARTGLRGQLMSRYMKELGTSYGVFIVAWMGNPIGSPTYRPVWKSLQAAQQFLTNQALSETADGRSIRTFVLDASLSAGTSAQGQPTKRASRTTSMYGKKSVSTESGHRRKGAAGNHPPAARNVKAKKNAGKKSS